MTTPETPARTPPPNKSPSLLYGLDAEKVEKELRTLRSMLEGLESSRPPRQRAGALLARLGIEGGLAHQLSQGASRAAKKGEAALRAFLKERMRSVVSVTGELLDQPGPALIACVGPTGVGKTTTLAKLAARARLDHGRTVAVISLDTFRVGALEQWHRYASLMGISFTAAHSADEFQQAVQNARAELVLVDTTGRSPTERGQSLAGECLAQSTERQRHVMLVLPAWLRARDAERVAQSYREMQPTGLCVTKLDETLEPGGALHGTLPDNLPLTYLCDGPRVPEDIAVADSDRVINTIFMDAS
jgi:flagellar biosynthesis protein FlhF